MKKFRDFYFEHGFTRQEGEKGRQINPVSQVIASFLHHALGLSLLDNWEDLLWLQTLHKIHQFRPLKKLGEIIFVY
jgi:hypothetical protein